MFKKRKPGEWCSIKNKTFLAECCDCGLKHLMKFRLVKNKSIEFQVFRIKKIKKDASGNLNIEYFK